MNVNTNDLLLMIGSQQVEIQLLRKQVADLQAAVKAATTTQAPPQA